MIANGSQKQHDRAAVRSGDEVERRGGFYAIGTDNNEVAIVLQRYIRRDHTILPVEHTTPDSEVPEQEGDTTQDGRARKGRRLSTLPPEAGRPMGPPPEAKTRRPEAAVPPEGAVYPLEPATPPEPDARRTADAHAYDRTVHQEGRRTDHSPVSIVVVALLAGVLGAAVTVGTLAVGGVFDRPSTVVSESPALIQPIQIVVSGDTTSTAAAVAQKVVPSIVTVEVGSENGDDPFNAFASGSGVVLSMDGFIVTNHHVIANAQRAQVVLQNGGIYEARIIGSDPLTDLAVLRIDATTLTPIELGTTTALSIGDQAVAVGNQLGLPGGASVTVGVVSAFDREVQIGPNELLFGMLQTDAPIQRGSSGGALVDQTGRLIGITTAIGVTDAGAEGVGFAIPVESVRRITDEIIESGQVRHAFLGVRLQDHFVARDGAQFPAGAEIVEFVPPSGAQAAGLESGDLLTLINGMVVLTTEDIVNELRRFRVGDTITFEVVRDGATFTAEVILGERPGDL